jgi:uncharacterized cupin superfamily protein
VSETFDLGLTRLDVVLAAEEATILGAEIQPGGGSTWHAHGREDETVLVVNGELVVDDGVRRVVHAGEAHVIPRGRRHAFANEGARPVRLYFFCAPGGLERFFRDLTSGVAVDEAAARADLTFG